jgi:predicted DNA-binding transcriptional regulator AlpA
MAPPSDNVPLFERLGRLLESREGRARLAAELDKVDPDRLLLLFRRMIRLMLVAFNRSARELVAAVGERQEFARTAQDATNPPASQPNSTMLDIQGVADRLGVHTSAVRRLIADGRLPEGREVGDRAIRYDSIELEAAIKRLPKRK